MEDDKKKTLEDLFSGVKQGGTFGYADEIGGLAGALGSLSGGDKRPFSELYREARDTNRGEYKEAQERSPKAYLGGNIAGGLTNLPAAGLKAMAAMGGAAGLGGSDADLTKGEVGQAALDTLEGAGTSAAMGGILHPDVLSKIKRTDIAKAIQKSVAKDQKLDAKKLAEGLGMTVGGDADTIARNKRLMSKAVGHQMLEKHGIDEGPNAVRNLLEREYPETSSLGDVVIGGNKEIQAAMARRNELAKQMGAGQIPQQTIQDPNIMGRFMQMNNKKGTYPVSLDVNTDNIGNDLLAQAGIAGHEGEHLIDVLKNPAFKSKSMGQNMTQLGLDQFSPEDLQSVAQQVKDPTTSKDMMRMIQEMAEGKLGELDPQSAIGSLTKGHHMDLGENYELQKLMAMVSGKEQPRDSKELAAMISKLRDQFKGGGATMQSVADEVRPSVFEVPYDITKNKISQAPETRVIPSKEYGSIRQIPGPKPEGKDVNALLRAYLNRSKK